MLNDSFGGENTESTTSSTYMTTPPALPTEMTSVATPPPIPQETNIDQAVNRYAEAQNTSLNDVNSARSNIEVAQYQHVEAQNKLETAQTAVENAHFPVTRLIAELKTLEPQRNEAQTQNTLDNANSTYENTIRTGAQALGGEGLAQANMSTIEHAMNPIRLETLVQANAQAPIENASAQMASSIDKQDELAKQLKQEAAQELEQKQVETFINTQMRNVENHRANLKPYGTEVIITSSPAIIEFCAKSALAHYPKEILPLDQTAGELLNKKWSNERDMTKDMEISTMTALEQEFSSRLAIISQAEKIATEKGEAFDLESFKQIYEKSITKIPSDRTQRYNDLAIKSTSYIARVEGVPGNLNLGGYPAGMLQEYLEITGHQNASELTSQELTNAYAFALAYNEKGIEPMDAGSFLIGLAMIESRGASDKNANIGNFRERFYGAIQQLPKTTKNMESIIQSIPHRSINPSSLLGQMAQWKLTH